MERTLDLLSAQRYASGLGLSATTFVVRSRDKPIVVRRLIDPSLPLFKYVDLADAHFLEKGSIKIGTLSGYGSLEGDHCDPMEHTVVRPGADRKFLWSNPEERAYIEASGAFKTVDDGENGGGIENISIITMGDDLNCLCLSYSDSCKEGFGDNQALFRIDKPLEFISRLCKVNRLPRSPNIGHVIYEERIATLTHNPLSSVDPFVKPLRFSGEFEVRMIWEPMISGDPKVIYGNENKMIARLLTRIW